MHLINKNCFTKILIYSIFAVGLLVLPQNSKADSIEKARIIAKFTPVGSNSSETLFNKDASKILDDIQNTDLLADLQHMLTGRTGHAEIIILVGDSDHIEVKTRITQDFINGKAASSTKIYLCNQMIREKLLLEPDGGYDRLFWHGNELRVIKEQLKAKAAYVERYYYTTGLAGYEIYKDIKNRMIRERVWNPKGELVAEGMRYNGKPLDGWLPLQPRSLMMRIMVQPYVETLLTFSQFKKGEFVSRKSIEFPFEGKEREAWEKLLPSFYNCQQPWPQNTN